MAFNSQITFTVVDDETGSPISGANVKIYHPGTNNEAVIYDGEDTGTSVQVPQPIQSSNSPKGYVSIFVSPGNYEIGIDKGEGEVRTPVIISEHRHENKPQIDRLVQQDIDRIKNSGQSGGFAFHDDLPPDNTAQVQSNTDAIAAESAARQQLRDDLNDRIVPPAADIDDLRARDTSSYSDRVVINVEDAGVGDPARYSFDLESTEAENGIDVIAPTTGPGRWIAKAAGAASDDQTADEVTSVDTYGTLGIANVQQAQDIFTPAITFFIDADVPPGSGNNGLSESTALHDLEEVVRSISTPRGNLIHQSVNNKVLVIQFKTGQDHAIGTGPSFFGTADFANCRLFFAPYGPANAGLPNLRMGQFSNGFAHRLVLTNTSFQSNSLNWFSLISNGTNTRTDVAHILATGGSIVFGKQGNYPITNLVLADVPLFAGTAFISSANIYKNTDALQQNILTNVLSSVTTLSAGSDADGQVVTLFDLTWSEIVTGLIYKDGLVRNLLTNIPELMGDISGSQFGAEYTRAHSLGKHSYDKAVDDPQFPGTAILKFTTVGDKKGNIHYDPATGLFTVPYTGEYEIDACLILDNNSSLQDSDVHLNVLRCIDYAAGVSDHGLSDEKRATWDTNRSSPHRIAGSLHLQAGDQIFLGFEAQFNPYNLMTHIPSQYRHYMRVKFAGGEDGPTLEPNANLVAEDVSASRAITSNDRNKQLESSSVTPINLTLNAALPVGFVITALQGESGSVTFVLPAGESSIGGALTTIGIGEGINLTKQPSGRWWATGIAN